MRFQIRTWTYFNLLLLFQPMGHAENIYQCKNHLQVEQIQLATKKIDERYQKFAQEHHVPGYIYGIVFNGKIIHHGQSGYADIQHKIPVTPNTYFRIASMTKSFTAMAIMQLRDAGKLQLDEPIAKYAVN